MINFIVELYQNYAFLQREWFYGLLQFLLALITAISAVVIWRRDSSKKLKEEHLQTLGHIVRNDLEMKQAFRLAWSHMSAFDGDSEQEIFRKDISEIKEDQVRAAIFQVIDILSDVLYYYQKFEIPLEDTLWIGNFKYVFNPVDKKAFVTAFYKHKLKHKFRQDFITYVDKIIEENNNPKPNPLSSAS